MRRRIIALLTGLLMTAGLLAATTAPAQADLICDEKLDRVSFFYDRYDVTQQIVVGYRHCVNTDTGAIWVEPKYTIQSYNTYRSFDCSVSVFQGTHANMYFWDPITGKNFNPGRFSLPCQGDGSASKTQFYDLADVPRLYLRPGGTWSKWKVVAQQNLQLTADPERIHAQRFEP